MSKWGRKWQRAHRDALNANTALTTATADMPLAMDYRRLAELPVHTVPHRRGPCLLPLDAQTLADRPAATLVAGRQADASLYRSKLLPVVVGGGGGVGARSGSRR